MTDNTRSDNITLKLQYIANALVCLTRVLGVADSERTPADLLFKQVLLVEEEDDGGEREPLVVADGVEKLHALMHPVLRKEQM